MVADTLAVWAYCDVAECYRGYTCIVRGVKKDIPGFKSRESHVSMITSGCWC
jgi:hypothetical protein